MKLKRPLARLILVTVFLTTVVVPVCELYALTANDLTQDRSETKIEPRTLVGGYNEIFRLVRFLTTNKVFVDFVKAELPDLLVVNADYQEALGVDTDKLKSVPEHIFLMGLRESPSLFSFVRDFQEEYYQASKLKDLKAEEAVIGKYASDFKEMFLQDLIQRAKENQGADQVRPLSLVDPNTETQGGITEVQLFSSTPRLVNQSIVPANDLIQVVIDFIQATENELVLNVFDFDVMEIADALIRAAHRGVSIRVGIDSGVVLHRAKVKKVYDKLVAAVDSLQLNGKCMQCKIHPVDSVSLNHQKMIATDWSLPGKGRVLTSSGNFTYSGINKNGDLSSRVVHDLLTKIERSSGVRLTPYKRTEISNLIAELRKKKSDGAYSDDERKWFYSELKKILKYHQQALTLVNAQKVNIDKLMSMAIPNANHMVTYRSDSFAQLVHHELTKTINLELRGRSGVKGYPFSSVYHIPRVDKSGYILVSFSPNGGFGKINMILANLIKHVPGDIRMMQFAFSAPEVAEALEEAVFKDNRTLKALGEGPFAMSYWSVFLRLSGLERPSPLEKKNDGILDYYYTSIDYPFSSYPQMANLRNTLRVAPKIYGTHSVRVLNNATVLTSKLHHKLITLDGLVSTPGTSHNFSKGAISNQEQIIIAFDAEITDYMNSIFDYMYSNTTEDDSIANVATLRNRIRRRVLQKEIPEAELSPRIYWGPGR